MKYIKGYFGYILCLTLLLLSILFCVLIYEKYKSNNITTIINTLNNYSEEKINNIAYPKFNIKVIDKEVDKLVNNYKEDKNTIIKYSVYINETYMNVFFNIVKNNETFYKNIDYDISNDKVFNRIDYNLFKDIILDKIKSKYNSDIFNIVVQDNFKNASYKINDDGIYFYFNDILFNGLIYKVYIFIPNENTSEVFSESYNKVVAFTFDDGPSQYTMEIVKTLVLNNSKATFFELGNRMKYNQEIVKEVIANGMEIGSHTYAHKNLNKLDIKEIDEEINSTNILFNEITLSDIKLIRTPYGNANTLVRSRVNMPIISWNIDTNDWLYRDSEYIYNHIINNIEDGDIILMHDVYPETVEAVKKVVPYLVSLGYKITTVSELASINNIILEKGETYRSLKVVE